MANRVLLGKRGSDYGLWISKPGKNVLTITEAEDFIFNSNWQRAAIVHEAGIVPNGEGATVIFATLPFVPHVEIWRIDGDRIFNDEESVVTVTSSLGGYGNRNFPSMMTTSSFFIDRLGAPAAYDFLYLVYKLPVIGA